MKEPTDNQATSYILVKNRLLNTSAQLKTPVQEATQEEQLKHKAFIAKMTDLSSKAQIIEQECFRGNMDCIARFKSWNEELSTYMHSHEEGPAFVQSDNQPAWPMELRQILHKTPDLHPEIQNVQIWLQVKQWFIGEWIKEHKKKLDVL